MILRLWLLKSVFLSNPSEAAMIAEETIQEKAAFQIANGNYAVSARSSDEFTIDIIRNLTIQECIVFSKAFSFVKSTIWIKYLLI